MVGSMIKRIAHYLKQIRSIIGHENIHAFPVDIDAEAIDIFKKVQPNTLTGIERVFALIQAIKYIVRPISPEPSSNAGYTAEAA